MTYEYKPGEVPVPARTCVRCGTGLEAEAARADSPGAGPGGRLAGWFHPSALSGATIWVFTSRGSPPTAAAERLRCPTCDRRYALVRA